MQGGAAGPPPPPSPDAERAQFEADKRAVYKHPLFPLLALLLERCEQATAGAETPDAFSADLQAFVQHQRRDRRPFLVDDPELDGLMIKSIQVLRIHLLELEKVQELCRDFCGRYIACLKTKMQSENLLRTDYGSGNAIESNNNMSGSVDDHSSTSNSPQYQQPPTVGYPYFNLEGIPSVQATPTGAFPQPPPAPHTPFDVPPLVVQGSTPLSQIGTPTITSNDSNSFTETPIERQQQNNSPLSSNTSECHSIQDRDDSHSEVDISGKRGGLPRRATQAMRSWLFQHLVHPYPTEEEKRSLAAETRLTLLQVNNWFINARRRILQPMLETDKPGKKYKNGSAVTKRFWSDAITNSTFNGLLSSSEDEDESGVRSPDSDERRSPDDNSSSHKSTSSPTSLHNLTATSQQSFAMQ